jgi:3-oxoacyl-[acyl-carrier protein] reductase
LGFATAKALAQEGVRVVICGRDRAKLDNATAKLGHGAIGLAIDVSRPEDAARFVREARAALGGLDILVTNAGGPPPGYFADTPLERYPEALALNLLSVVAMCQEAVPGMQAQHWGRVVAITSIAVRQPIPNLILSNTARAGATGFLKTLAREVAKDGVTVNSLQPGLHATARVTQLHGEDLSALAATVPAGIVGAPDDFGRFAAFLCSEHARFVTGTAIPVDGGSYAALL